MTEPGILYGGRGSRGGYGPYARFGDLELLIDARRTIGLEGKIVDRAQDLSPSGTNYLVPFTPGAGFVGKVDGIRGQTALGVGDGVATGGFQRNPLARPITGALTVVVVCQFNALSVFGCVFDRADGVTGSRVVMALGADQNSLDFSSGAGINSGGGTIAPNVPLLVVCVANGASSLLRLNRGAVSVPGTVGAVDWQSIRFGSLSPAGGGDMNGRLGLAGFYRGALNLDRILALEDFVNRDWRLGL